jgi:hypothetical protein
MMVRVLSLSLLAPSLLLPIASAQQTAALQGVILDPSGRPAPAFKVVFKDVVTGTEYTSSASNAAGEYSLQVPTGSRYQLIRAVASDGTSLPVQAGAPLPIRAAGVYRRDVQFQLVGGAKVPEKTVAPKVEEPKPPPKPPVTTAKPQPKPASKPAPASQARVSAKKPWWKTPGGVVGIVLGAGAVVAVAAGGGGGSSSSPSNP